MAEASEGSQRFRMRKCESAASVVRRGTRFLSQKLERRCLLSTTVLDAGGTELGRLDVWTPPGGLKAVEVSTGSGRQGSGDVAGYQIEVVFEGGLTASQQAVFASAASRWEAILTGDVEDVGPGAWGNAVDDMRISAQGLTIDGSGGILGQAGPEYYRSDTNLPFTGVMQFDSADLATLEQSGQLQNVIVHEMGHVLGLGTMWQLAGLVTGVGSSNPIFTGPRATAEYRRLIGDPTATSVPVENTGSAGTRDAHWRESVFGNELMTGYLNNGANPLSRVTAAQFADFGYPLVNVDATDPYTISNPLPTIGTLSATPTSTAVGGTFTLSVSGASDNAAVASVSFYRESNGIPGLQASDTGSITPDTLLNTDTSAPFSTSVPLGTLPTGSYTYYARAQDNFGAFSAVATTTATVVAAPVTPAAPDLVSSSDTGTDQNDNLTANNTPTFVGTIEPGATVTLLANGVAVGTAEADASGFYTVTSSVVSDGVVNFTVTSTQGGQTSAPSPSLTVQIDTVAPTVASATFVRTPGQLVRVNFSEAISGAGSLELINTTTAQIIPTTPFVVDEDTINYVVMNAALIDGRYEASFTSPPADAAGNTIGSTPLVLTFSFLRADFNGDNAVGFDDLLTLAQNYGQTGTNATGDADYNGVVDFDDLLIVAQTYGTSLSLAGERRRESNEQLED